MLVLTLLAAASSGSVLEIVSQNESKIIFRSGDADCELAYSQGGELVSSCPIRSSVTDTLAQQIAELQKFVGLTPPSLPPPLIPPPLL